MKFSISALCFFILLPCALHAVEPIEIGDVRLERTGDRLQLRWQENLVLPDLDLGGDISRVERRVVEHSKWGEGLGFHIEVEGGHAVRANLYKDSPFLHLTTIYRHGGTPGSPHDGDWRVVRAKGPRFTFALPGELNAVTSSGIQRLGRLRNPGSFGYFGLANPETRHGVVVAVPRAHVSHTTLHGENGKPIVSTRVDFGHLNLKPGEERAGDPVLVGYFEDVRLGLEAYARHAVVENAIDLKPKPGGVYCTWYHRKVTGSGASTPQFLRKNAAFAQRELQPYGLDVLQIDDHWQSSHPTEVRNELFGDLENGPIKMFSQHNAGFPGGMPSMSDDITQRGFTSGIWFMPFSADAANPGTDPEALFRLPDGSPWVARWSGSGIDATHPKGLAWLKRRFTVLHDWGYRYIKVDGHHSGTPSQNVYIHRFVKPNGRPEGVELYDQTKTHAEGYRIGQRLLREIFHDTFILGCSMTQNMRSMVGAYGMVDAMRVGPDNDKAGRGNWRSVNAGPDFSINLYFLNNRVWHNDPDPFYVRDITESLGDEPPEGVPLIHARWMATVSAIMGALNTTSEQYSQLPAERLELIRRTVPAHNVVSRPIDFLERHRPQLFLLGEAFDEGPASRDPAAIEAGKSGRRVLGLVNWSDKQTLSIDRPLVRCDLDGDRYIAFDYWQDSFLRIEGSLRVDLKPMQANTLGLVPTADLPRVVSSNRHITQGMVDILAEEWDGSTLRGRSLVVAGDRYELRLALPEGMSIESASFAGLSGEVAPREELGQRVSFEPKTTGDVSWEIHVIGSGD